MVEHKTLNTVARGQHPTKDNRWLGKPIDCFANITTIVTDKQVVISMNGTAVFSLSEFRQYIDQIQKAIETEKPG